MLRTAAAIVLLLGALAPTMQAQTTETLRGTPHDFSDLTGSDDDGCAMCHLPFASSGNKGGTDEPEVYASVMTVDGTDGMGMESALCLSCHDGLNGPSVGGVDGSHPITVEYDASALPRLRSVAEVEARGLRLVSAEGTYWVECTSCHNPHDNTGGDFLRVSNRGSALCLGCHIT